jgi:predicted GIY-YIG superfamily endonuclease
MENWYVYICESKAGYYYTGIAINPHARLVRHNTAQGAKMARDQGDFSMIYVSKPFSTKSEARKREIQIKGWTRLKKEKLINGEWR